MNVFDIIYEQPEMLGEADSIDTAEALKKAFTQQEWFNIFTFLAADFLKGKTDERKYGALQDLNDLLGQNSRNVSPADWSSDAQLYGIQTGVAGPNLDWQKIYDILAPHRAKKSNIKKPQAGEDPVTTKVDKTGTLSMIATWVPVPEKIDLNADEARAYYKALIAEFNKRATPKFAEFWKLPGTDKDGNEKVNILQRLFIKYNDTIKKDLADDGLIRTQRVQNIFAAWLDTCIDIYKQEVGEKPFK